MINITYILLMRLYNQIGSDEFRNDVINITYILYDLGLSIIININNYYHNIMIIIFTIIGTIISITIIGSLAMAPLPVPSHKQRLLWIRSSCETRPKQVVTLTHALLELECT